MKKIKSQVNPKDRVVCVTVIGAHKFYFEPYKSHKRLFLFETEDFSGSVFAYFRDNGRCMGERGFSLTIKELYEDRKMYRNPKVGKIFDMLPGKLDKAISKNNKKKEQVKSNNRVKNADKGIYDDRELAA